jgi:hypothetical protein
VIRAAAFAVVAGFAAGVLLWAAAGSAWQVVPVVAVLVLAAVLLKGR